MAEVISDSTFVSAPWGVVSVSRIDDGPLTRAEAAHMTIGRIPYTEGLVPQERTQLPGYDSGVLCLLIGLFLLLSYNFRHYSTFLKNFFTDLVSTRRREGTFEVRTFSETGVLMSIVLMACLSQGIIINAALSSSWQLWPGLTAFMVIGGITLAGVAYYLWQLLAYGTVGAIFTDKASAKMWLKGFNASQALLAGLLFIPALVVLFNPGAWKAVFGISVFGYFLARFTFIIKGFRLFYTDFGSLLYFILYLCTLEIVPLVVLYRAVESANDYLLLHSY